MGNIIGGVVGGLLGRSSGRRQAEAIRESTERAAGIVQPFADVGLEAVGDIRGALGFADPTAANQAFENFQRSTGFQAALRAGTQAIEGSQAARGLLESGSTLAALQERGQGLAQRGFMGFLANLQNLAGLGAGAATNVARQIASGGRAAAGATAQGDAALQSGLGQAAQGVFSRIGI